MKVIIEVESDNPAESNQVEFRPTENCNFVSMKVNGSYYDVPIAELYRATMPFMDLRYEQLTEA